MKPLTLSAILTTVLISSVCGMVPVRADPGDPAGWFLNVDPRHRAFLTWTPAADGPRLLMLACLRDAQMFTTLSAAVGEHEEVKAAKLRLSDGTRVFETEGEISFYPHTNRSAFISDVDADDAAMRAIGGRLLPLLQGRADLSLDIGAPPMPRAAIPHEGLDRVLPRFIEVCFR